MNKDFQEFIAVYQQKINQRLDELLLQDVTLNSDLRVMMQYSLDAGGKRIRPLFLLAILKSFNHNINENDLTVGSAIEAVHTYSLIHDDLPAMDNDDLRRGKPTSHKKFGEAQAILAGDALLTQAFEWLTRTKMDDCIKVELVRQLASAAGASGMISGQLLDIQGNRQNYTLTELQKLHSLKTGRMLIYPAQAALTIIQSKDAINALILDFVKNFGLAFQIHDDIIDVTQPTEELGKTAGKDISLNKNTYVNLLGIDQAQLQLDKIIKNCEDALERLNKFEEINNVSTLKGFLAYLK